MLIEKEKNYITIRLEFFFGFVSKPQAVDGKKFLSQAGMLHSTESWTQLREQKNLIHGCNC